MMLGIKRAQNLVNQRPKESHIQQHLGVVGGRRIASRVYMIDMFLSFTPEHFTPKTLLEE